MSAAALVTQISVRGCVTTKPYLQEHEACQLWPMSLGLQTPPALKAGNI